MIIVSAALCLVASFFLKVVFKFLFPEHPFYLMMNSFLLQRPALDIRDLPLFYSMFNSSTMQVRGSLSLYPITWNKFRFCEKATIILIYTEFRPTLLIQVKCWRHVLLRGCLWPSPIAFSLSRVLGVSRYWAACGKAHFLVSRHQFYLAGFSNHYLWKHVQGCM